MIEDVYASHLPVLKMIGESFPISSVLELGCGNYSTRTFLDRKYFPNLSWLFSYETDKGWWKSVHEAFGDDDRLTLVHAEFSLDKIVETANLSPFDLIFVDNGNTVIERVEVLEVLNKKQPKAMVIVHDYNVQEYQHSTRSFPIKTVYSRMGPETAILYSMNSPEFSRMAQYRLSIE